MCKVASKVFGWVLYASVRPPVRLGKVIPLHLPKLASSFLPFPSSHCLPTTRNICTPLSRCSLFEEKRRERGGRQCGEVGEELREGAAGQRCGRAGYATEENKSLAEKGKKCEGQKMRPFSKEELMQEISTYSLKYTLQSELSV